jgi:hypothetical protein
MCATYLDLTYRGQASRFTMTVIDRERLYGSRKRVALDATGHECTLAHLTQDGRYILPSGATADLYVTENGDAVSRRELVVVDRDNKPLPTLAPTTGKPQAIEGPIPETDLLEHVVTRVYALAAGKLAPELERMLREGAIFRVPFRPRRAVTGVAAFILANEAGVFLVQGEPCSFEFVGLQQPVAVVDTDDGELNADGFDSWWDTGNAGHGGIHDAA